jgi:hypothetical protein
VLQAIADLLNAAYHPVPTLDAKAIKTRLQARRSPPS